MIVIVGKPWNRRAAAEVDGFGARIRRGTLFLAHGRESAVLNEHFQHDGIVLVHRVDFAVEEPRAPGIRAGIPLRTRRSGVRQ